MALRRVILPRSNPGPPCFCADYYTYRRFLRARQHDIERAVDMWQKHLEWRKVGSG